MNESLCSVTRTGSNSSTIIIDSGSMSWGSMTSFLFSSPSSCSACASASSGGCSTLMVTWCKEMRKDRKMPWKYMICLEKYPEGRWPLFSFHLLPLVPPVPRHRLGVAQRWWLPCVKKMRKDRKMLWKYMICWRKYPEGRCPLFSFHLLPLVPLGPRRRPGLALRWWWPRV